MAIFVSYRQSAGPLPLLLDGARPVSLLVQENVKVNGVSCPTAIELRYQGLDGSALRATFGGDALAVSFASGSPVFTGVVRSFLQEMDPGDGVYRPVFLFKATTVLAEQFFAALNGVEAAEAQALTEFILRDDDTIRLSPLDDPLAASSAVVRGYSGDDVLRGGARNDRMRGDNGDDILEGGDGADVLNGGHGRDTLYGGRGRDTLRGDLSGNLQRDVFAYKSSLDSMPGSANRDVIVDFVGAGGLRGDRIDLSAIDAVPSTRGVNEAFVYIGSAPFSGVATQGEVRFTTRGGNGLLSVNLPGRVDPLLPPQEMEILLTDVSAFSAGFLIL